MAYSIELLASRHDRAGFSCGEPSLDAYIQRQARQDMQRDLAACYALCAQGSDDIIGYYTLSATAVELTELPADLAKKAGRYPLVPAVLLGRLAVSSTFQGQGMSTILILDALRRTLLTGVGVKLVVVDALDERTAVFYERREFRRFTGRSLRLYLPMNRVRELFPGEGSDPGEHSP